VEPRKHDQSSPDATVQQLATLFRTHPAWLSAASLLQPEASSSVFFSHRPGEAWRLERRDGVACLLPGAATDPDLVFCFPPAAVEALARVDGRVGDFAVELFGLVAETRPDLRVRLRVAAPFARLVRRGYLSLLAAGGWRVLAVGAKRGVRSIAELRALVEASRRSGPQPWEGEAAAAQRDPERTR